MNNVEFCSLIPLNGIDNILRNVFLHILHFVLNNMDLNINDYMNMNMYIQVEKHYRII